MWVPILTGNVNSIWFQNGHEVLFYESNFGGCVFSVQRVQHISTKQYLSDTSLVLTCKVEISHLLGPVWGRKFEEETIAPKLNYPQSVHDDKN